MGGGGGGGMGQMMAANQMTEIPAQLEPRFRIIKLSLVTLIVSLFVKIIAGGVINPGSTFFWIYSSLNPIFNVVIGIFLLKDDPLIGRIHRCCITTICSRCQEQCPCPGGMPCLCSWFFCTTVTALLSIIPFWDRNGVAQSDMAILVGGLEDLNNPSRWAGGIPWVIAFCLFLAGTFFGLLAEIVGAFQGFQAFKEANAIAQGADYQGGYPDAESGGGGGGSSGGGSRYVQGGCNVQAGEGAPRQSSMQQPFTAFGGSGQRLGS